MHPICSWLPFILLVPTAALAQSLKDFVPLKETHCSVTSPPEAAGVSVTPGGFLMVFPRNAALRKDYTGCKILWVVDGERPLRMATLYFERGALRTAVAHDMRSPAAALDAVCSFPAGKSLMPKSGRKISDAGCTGFAGEDVYGLLAPTWPRICMIVPDDPKCAKDPE